jgi:non-heme chloroperoxidase
VAQGIRSLWGNAVLLANLLTPIGAQSFSHWSDPSPHKAQFVTVERNVRLEILDWGGTGRPIVLLAGLGGTAHIFDDFAVKLTGSNHVYGITRRGFGASSVPASGYDADRLGDDVLAVLEALKLENPVLVGESIGGEELSSIGSRYPRRVAGLVYLDAGYQYAFDNGKGSAMEEIQRYPPPQSPDPNDADFSNFGTYQAWFQKINGITFPEAEFRQAMESKPDGRVGERRTLPRVPEAVMAGIRKYTEIPVPVLAIYAVPHDLGPWINGHRDPDIRAQAAAFSEREAAWTEKQAKAFEEGVPSARVVRLPGANHEVFLSHEADILREIRDFLAKLQ